MKSEKKVNQNVNQKSGQKNRTKNGTKYFSCDKNLHNTSKNRREFEANDRQRSPPKPTRYQLPSRSNGEAGRSVNPESNSKFQSHQNYLRNREIQS